MAATELNQGENESAQTARHSLEAPAVSDVPRVTTLREEALALALGAVGGTIVGFGLVFLIVWLVA
jgi:hypothetical protein